MLWKFDYKFDRERLLLEAKNPLGYKGAISAAKENVYLDKQGRPTKDKISFERELIKTKNIQKKSMPYADEIWKYFTELVDMECLPKIWFYPKGAELPFHIDRWAKCSINIVLTENPDPILFEGGSEIYTVALVNTQKLHAVRATNDRYLYKIKFLKNSWEEVKDVIQVRL